MRLRHPISPPARRAFRALQAIERVVREGCRVVVAGDEGLTRTRRGDRRPSWADTYGYAVPPAGCVRVPVLCIAERWGTRITWISKEKSQ